MPLSSRNDSCPAADASLDLPSGTYRTQTAPPESTGFELAERTSVRGRPKVAEVGAEDAIEQELAKLEERYGPGARAAFERLASARTGFLLGALCHELASSLTPLGAAATVLEEALRKADVEPGHALEYFQAAYARTRLVVSRTRELASSPSPGVPRYVENLRRLVEDAIEMVAQSPVAQDHGLSLRIDVAPSLWVEGSADRLRLALTHLIRNAVEASEALRPIPLRIAAKRCKSGRIVIVVSDRGVGLSPDETRRALTQPFARNRTKKNDGVGLGLLTVKKIVEIEHRGRVRLVSRKGEGTTVTLLLPETREEDVVG